MRMTPRRWLYVAATGTALAVLGVLIRWVILPPVVHWQVGKTLALKTHSDAWYRFVDLPLPLSAEFRIFNVTNREGVYLGERPRFQEVGPYVYKQYRHKFDVTSDTDEDTISYYQRLIYVFDSESSGTLREDDVVVVANPALLGMLGVMTNIPVLSSSTSFVDLAAPVLFNSSDVFLTTTAGALVMGGVTIPCGKLTSSSSSDRVAATMALSSGQLRGANAAKLAALITCSSMKRIKVPTITEESNGDLKFSLFGYKNYTPDGYYTVKSGISEPSKLGQIVTWDGKKYVSAWGGPTCNAVNGTQGDIFSPYVTRDTDIQVFSTDICRSMTIKYKEDSSYRGIASYRFAAGIDNLMDVLHDGNMYCFCPQIAKSLTVQNGCLRKGALDLSGCQGIPVIITFPHFLDADTHYLNAVEGLDPNEDQHRMIVDIEPMTGTPLYGGKKMQVNFEMREVEGVSITSGLSDTLMPVAWMYEGVALNDEMLDLLNSLLFNILKIVDGISYGLMALGGVLLLGGAVQYFRTRRALEKAGASNGGVRAKSKNGELSVSLSASSATNVESGLPSPVPPDGEERQDVPGYKRHS